MALENAVTEDDTISQGDPGSSKRRRGKSISSVPGMHFLLIINSSSSIYSKSGGNSRRYYGE
jgi:hypothetical protein